MSDFIVVTDVGPRDGLQNQPKILSIAERLQLIAAIASAGVNSIEVGSFVSPKAVPVMAGAPKHG
jgi:hydroxymethylglutaryl-CoA lyase